MRSAAKSILMGFPTLLGLVGCVRPADLVPRHGSGMAPTAAWTVQQRRDLTPFGIGPMFLLCDNNGKFTIVVSSAELALPQEARLPPP